MLAFMLFVSGFVCLFILIAFLTRPAYTSPRIASAASSPLISRGGLPWVPQTVEQARVMDPGDFELLAAAVILAMGQGHTFAWHSGQSGDEGVDVVLLNMYRLRVVVQCKRYGSDSHVTPEQVLSFWGAIQRYDAAYGYLVTTSTFSASAQRIADDKRGRIYRIDQYQLAWQLQQRSHEIALAYADVLRQKQASG